MLTTEQIIQEDQYLRPYHYFIERGSYYGNFYFSYVDEVSRLVNSFSPYRVLDVGCGDGFLLNNLPRDNGLELVGVDYSARAIDLAKLFTPVGSFVDFKIADMAELPFPDNSFDVVTSVAVLEHLPKDNLDIAIDEMIRVACPGGRLVFAVPTKNLAKPQKHFQHFTLEGFSKLFSDKKVDLIYSTGTSHFLFRKIIRLFDNRFYELKVLTRFLRNYFFYRYLSICSVDYGEMMVLVFKKKDN